MITSYSRGHLIIYRIGRWVYADTGEPLDDGRPCIACNLSPTSEGFDACIGGIIGATSACCGHGVEEPYVKYKEDEE